MDTTTREILDAIAQSINRILAEQDLQPAVIDAETRLLANTDVEIDSLDLAVLVTELQEVTNVDPFADGFVPFSTAGELAELFAAAKSSGTR